MIPDIGNSSKICLQTWMGTYVCAEGGGGGIVVVNRAHALGWETFEMTRIDNDRVTLKAFNGQYVCAENGGGTILAANRDVAAGWETFTLYVGSGGMVSLAAMDGSFLCAEPHGALMANRREAHEWESFLVLDPMRADSAQTKISISVYKIGTAPFWHTGTVIDRVEYFFDTTNRVETTTPHGMGGVVSFHRDLSRFVSGNMAFTKSTLDSVVQRWNGTPYDLLNHNCNFFTDDLLNSLGVSGLDREYLDSGGIGKGLRQLPGSSIAEELLVKWPISDKRLDQAFMEDIRKLERLPGDVRDEIQRFVDRVGGAIPHIKGPHIKAPHIKF